MRRTLPLLQAPKPAAIEQVSCSAPNPDCRKCALHRQPFFNRCVPAAAEGDLESGERLLTIGIAPGREEDRQNRPNVGESGAFLRFQLKAQWKGAIAHTNAVACYPGLDEKTGGFAEIKTDYIDACRPYVRNVIREFQPTRILAFGTQAIHSLFNRAPGIMAVRRGFSWLLNHHDNRHDCPTWYVNVEGDEQVPWGCRCEPIPVLFLMHPAAACRNRFVKKDWMEDLKWALTTPDSFFMHRYIFLREGKVEPIETVERTAAVLAELEATCRKSGKPIVLDVETRGKQFNKDFRIISLALCIAGENRAYVWTAKALQNLDIVHLLVSSFDDENNVWVEQSDYDEVSIVAAWGHKLAGERRDTRLIRRLMEPGVKSDLGTMSERVGMGGYKVDFDVLVDQAIKRCVPKKATRSVKSKSSGGWEPLQTTMFDDCPDPEARLAIWEGYKSGDDHFEPRTYAYAIVPTEQTTIYNGQDVISTGLYHEMAWPELRKRKNLAMVWDELSCPSGRSYAQMRIWGIPADRQAITTLIHWAQTQQATAERACRRHLLDTKWADMNIGSDRQVGKLLFSPLEDGGFGLFPVKRTKGNAPSTDKESMAALADKHPFVADYSRYAYWDGFVNKGKEFLRSIRADGRMHPSYLPDGTETGRSSATDPNVFNIRRADDCPACKGKEPAMLSCETCDGSGIDPDTKKQRDMIRAEDGYVLVEVDLSQVELRGMAVMSGDEVMSTAFTSGLDIHQYAAEVATRISGMNITRQDAKWVNFGIGYGMTDDTLAKKLKCTKEKAKCVMDAIYGAYKGVMAHKDWMVNYVRQHGRTFTVWFQQKEDGTWQTVMAGQRPLYDIASEDGGRRHHAENAAYNTLIQGTFSGFLVLDAHARVCRYIEEEGLEKDVQVILSVYDSIILHCEEPLVEMMAEVVRRIMTRCTIGYTKDGKPFPLKADVKVGKSYGSMKKLEHWKKERAARRS